MQNFSILFLVALKPEWAFFKKSYNFVQIDTSPLLYQIKDIPQVALLQTGPTQNTARVSFQKFLQKYSANQILHFGTCGSLRDDFQVTELFLAQSILKNEIKLLHCQDRFNQSFIRILRRHDIPFQQGKLYTSEKILKNKEEKTVARQTFSVDTVDMESYDIADICSRNKIPYTCLRGIFDSLTDNLETLGEPYNEKGNLQSLKMTKNILTHPKLIFQLPVLKKRMDVIQKRFELVIKDFLNENISRRI